MSLNVEILVERGGIPRARKLWCSFLAASAGVSPLVVGEKPVGSGAPPHTPTHTTTCVHEVITKKEDPPVEETLEGLAVVPPPGTEVENTR